MLTYLTIRNFAIIEHLELQPSAGFNALTGETGAGKSIIIDAVSLLLGGRADTDHIRAGSDQALIEGVFSLPGTQHQRLILPLLREHGLEDEGEGQLILTREINLKGRNLCRVNGRLTTLGVLRQIGQQLVDIHNQGEHLSLLRVRQHVDFLDRYGGLLTLRDDVGRLVRTLHGTRAELSRLLQDERELAHRMDLLQYQIEEIAAARLEPGEEEDLNQERVLLSNAERLLSESNGLYRTLHEGEGAERSILDLLGEVSEGLAKLAELDGRLAGQQKALEETTYQLQEVAAALRSYGEGIEYDPQRLLQVEERLDLIYGLKRKYGDSIAEILAYGESAAKELATLSHSEERIEELRSQEQELLVQISQLASELSMAREEASRMLAEAMEAELKDLGMEKARFSVAIEQRPAEEGVQIESRRLAFDHTGIDQVEFMISPNVGEPLKPLSKIASGGETARLMLAMKTVLSAADEVPVLIFDEIDAGLGGRGGAVVGRKLWTLGWGHQVLCVTHLPQIAAFGDAHYKVAKSVVEGRTMTSVADLVAGSRTDELAEMLGTASDATHESALEMRQEVEKWKAAQGR
ncbi:MAG: DNA repair protein RecN [Anaerolineae bacterium]|nr:DNA repair protein RecN [Anaerolineae bacterium]NIN99457.1 DNA repair protein RecN [Anaerolineae bacterium]NIQ82322.1 DNA repair protein RecN [Anaerolineae bacterium]